jgi:hypothetical protein
MLARDAPHDETFVESRTSRHRSRQGLMRSELDRVVLIFGAAVTWACAAEAPTLSNFVRDRVSCSTSRISRTGLQRGPYLELLFRLLRYTPKGSETECGRRREMSEKGDVGKWRAAAGHMVLEGFR